VRGRIPAVNPISRINLAFKAIRELGPRQLGLYGLYKLGLRVGYFKRKTKISDPMSEGHLEYSDLRMEPILSLPDPAEIRNLIGQAGLSRLIAEADEIVHKTVRLFGGEPVPLRLALESSLTHWTNYDTGYSRLPETQLSGLPAADIKFIWEPARFGWALKLGRAYHLTQDERYSESFWRYFEEFHKANPSNLGPNWISAQEVALRILPFVFCGQVFSDSPHSTPTRKACLAFSVASHAQRIIPTLIYARAQNNNHLLSEAAGLITASLALPDHPDAGKWGKSGWKWFNTGLETQIASGGVYVQHSTNYHRLMLQLALWIYAVQGTKDPGQLWDSKAIQTRTGRCYLSSLAWSHLGQATEWLKALIDSNSGRAPNLGHNDGAYILPLTVLPFHDYRPVVQTAFRIFLGTPGFNPGIWDEMSLWFGHKSVGNRQPVSEADSRKPGPEPATVHHPNGKSWVYLRAAQITDRPGHADQLHVDLWWRGLNIAQDAGTYLYNADPPWDNSLTHTAVHNTVMVDGLEQMNRVGRFLYLDRAQGEIISHEGAGDGSWDRIIAMHDGYLRLGTIHCRSVTAHQDGRWEVEDNIQADQGVQEKSIHLIRLHWLLPDWEMDRLEEGTGVRIKSSYGWITLGVSAKGEGQIPPGDLRTLIVRGGERIHGTGSISPNWGWISPTYGVKIPALSFSVTYEGLLPLTFFSEWRFPEG
jgi:hypothetical protein